MMLRSHCCTSQWVSSVQNLQGSHWLKNLDKRKTGSVDCELRPQLKLIGLYIKHQNLSSHSLFICFRLQIDGCLAQATVVRSPVSSKVRFFIGVTRTLPSLRRIGPLLLSETFCFSLDRTFRLGSDAERKEKTDYISYFCQAD